ncbi:hypothetical protein [Streptomyces venezuelae]|uniref:Uncharacterized protein n=1 Tax=Streptomyces venezuelae TaxID=54571 RepID=A0A5P2BKK9_STRVZ|nr:hypothetical protein [Streptomyces venezuelae]QES30966.1 hypothetical protein DEJ47_35185 [Streptomyces venezuelae]
MRNATPARRVLATGAPTVALLTGGSAVAAPARPGALGRPPASSVARSAPYCGGVLTAGAAHVRHERRLDAPHSVALGRVLPSGSWVA